MKHHRGKAEQKRIHTATHRITRAKKILAKAGAALKATKKRISAARRAYRIAAKQ